MSTTKTIILCVAGLLLFDAGTASAEKVCARVRRGRLEKRSVTAGNCPRGFITLVDTATLSGPAGAAGASGVTGATGAAGADGAIRVYGDGSDGAVTFSASGDFPANRQYTDIVVDVGVNMSVKYGTVIRCTGTITINGRIVAAGAAGGGGNLGSWPASSTYFARDLILPAQNIANSPAGSGAVTSTGVIASGGTRGFAHIVSTGRDSVLLADPLLGGGSGAGAVNAFGGVGGGAIVILCKQGISIPAGGEIAVTGNDGGAGGGGGAAGTVLLASSGEISGAGMIRGEGRNGGSSSTTSAAGGGGGGALVQLFAPVVSFAGTTSLIGGVGGTAGAPVSGTIRSGGGGGGASGGDGGNGGTVNADNSSTNGSDGSSGVLSTYTIDPTALLLMQ